MEQRDAQEALAAMHAARGRMAGRARWSFVRHAAVGLVMGVLVASFALPAPWQIAVTLACLGATGAIVARDRRRDGFFVSGYRRGRTRPLTLALCGAMAAAMLAVLMVRGRPGMGAAPLLLGILAAVVATAVSLWWERIYRRELEDGADGR